MGEGLQPWMGGSEWKETGLQCGVGLPELAAVDRETGPSHLPSSQRGKVLPLQGTLSSRT